MAQGLTDMTRANEFRERPEEALKLGENAADELLARAGAGFFGDMA